MRTFLLPCPNQATKPCQKWSEDYFAHVNTAFRFRNVMNPSQLLWVHSQISSVLKEMNMTFSSLLPLYKPGDKLLSHVSLQWCNSKPLNKKVNGFHTPTQFPNRKTELHQPIFHLPTWKKHTGPAHFVALKAPRAASCRISCNANSQSSICAGQKWPSLRKRYPQVVVFFFSSEQRFRGPGEKCALYQMMVQPAFM